MEKFNQFPEKFSWTFEPATSVTVTSASTVLYRRLSQWSWARRAPGSCGRHTSRFRCRWSGLARCATRGSFHWSNTWHGTLTDMLLQRHLDLLTYLRYFYKFRNFIFSVMCIHDRLRMKIFNVYVRGRPIQQHCVTHANALRYAAYVIFSRFNSCKN